MTKNNAISENEPRYIDRIHILYPEKSLLINNQDQSDKLKQNIKDLFKQNFGVEIKVDLTYTNKNK